MSEAGAVQKSLVSETQIEDAMDNRFDGVDAYDIVQEVLALEAKLKAKERECAHWKKLATKYAGEK